MSTLVSRPIHSSSPAPLPLASYALSSSLMALTCTLATWSSFSARWRMCSQRGRCRQGSRPTASVPLLLTWVETGAPQPDINSNYDQQAIRKCNKQSGLRSGRLLQPITANNSGLVSCLFFPANQPGTPSTRIVSQVRIRLRRSCCTFAGYALHGAASGVFATGLDSVHLQVPVRR